MRTKGWETRLLDFIASRRAEPFAWGTNDCATFAADAALAQTGVDPMAEWRGYATEFGAGRVLVDAGAETLADLVQRVLPECPVGMAQRGDIALVNDGNMAALMVVEGDTLVGPDVDGLKRVPRSLAARAWRVG